MRKTEVICDHCGKRIPNSESFDHRISWFKDFDADLCFACATDIVDYVYDFFNIEETVERKTEGGDE